MSLSICFTEQLTKLACCMALLCLFVCQAEDDGEKPALFTKILPSRSNITFNNEIEPFESDMLNALEYDPLFNGGGVGVGDFNSDGLQDVFFSGNLVSSRLYLNQGDFKFRDVTELSGVGTKKWCTGVSVADVNLDGQLDIYLSVAGPDTSRSSRANLLFINQGNGKDAIPVFKEMAKEYGLDDSGFSIQAAFFDYDRDNDLDCYILTNAIEKTGRNRIRPKKVNGKGPSNDRLYLNAGNKDGHPVFENVSAKAGILKEGYGLGLCVTDLDQDGWLDIYCANDFVSNDLVWMNNHDGTFTDRAAEYFDHTSYNSMGVDVQDFNNDGLPDVCVVDMLPETIERKKMMVIKTSWEFFELARQMNYQDQYVRNVLQLNRGKDKQGEIKFSDIGQLAGVYATDWSWAPLLADLDNDGNKDLLVSNGYRRDITNLDYVVYLNQEASRYGNQFSPDTRRKMLEALYKLPEVKLHNYVYKNNGDLTFEDKSLEWGMGEKTYSNGAAYADLDNDGDLDLIFNDIDAEAGIYRNDLIRDSSSADSMHYARIKLEGEGTLPAGAKAFIKIADDKILYQENLPVRGYMSSVEPIMHFGLGKHAVFDAEIIWSNGQSQLERNLEADRTHIIRYNTAKPAPEPMQDVKSYFTMLDADQYGLEFTHEEFPFNEFKRTPALPHQFSRNSPGIAVGDADGNGLDDVFIGADRGKDRSVFFQRSPGKFSQVVQGKNDTEDMGALFFDADSDGDEDLYVVSGGSVYTRKEDMMYQDRLYLNDGKGKLTRGEDLVPETRFSGSVAVAADFDRDGDIDIFRGSRVSAGEYPVKPLSYLLQNQGAGKFADVTSLLAADLQAVGMISGAVWSDYNNDGWFDLIVVGEFMPVSFFRNERGKLTLDRDATISHSVGWWNGIASGDFDQDGDMDYVAGNLGLNTQYRASHSEPVRLYASDYDNNGGIDPVISYYRNGTEYAVPIRDVMHEQITAIMRKRFVSYTEYANADISKVLSKEDRAQANVLAAYEMRTSYIENLGNGKFKLKPLPVSAQFSPVFGISVADYNNDGLPDVLLAGNSHASETYSGWYDASLGTLLTGDGNGNFKAIEQRESGLYLQHDAKALASVFTKKEKLIVVANNNGPVEMLRSNAAGHQFMRLGKMDAWALIRKSNGKIQKMEFTYGQGYLSQSSRVLQVDPDVRAIEIYDFLGKASDR